MNPPLPGATDTVLETNKQILNLIRNRLRTSAKLQRKQHSSTGEGCDGLGITQRQAHEAGVKR